jgi:hypothetical protein
MAKVASNPSPVSAVKSTRTGSAAGPGGVNA